ncbi:putative elongator complex protein 1 [Drosophila willistoni]|uniref:putative elongator complex protein 1 n=1 Tax=Drosophila willistoni TaxID=7260 RepID=UPI00017D8EE1|nr:putative elongator complex protein 1 [Drosophila willistoni]
MRNLKLQYCKELTTDVNQPKQLLIQPIETHNGESGGSTSYVVTSNNIVRLETENSQGRCKTKIIADLPDIVSAEYLQLDAQICVATGGGEVLIIQPDTLETREGTFCDVGIECMSWSPNQEVVAFITKTHNVVVMTCTYDLIAEQQLDQDLSKEQEFVNVGWGKKETQFQGTAGKAAAKEKPEETTLNDNDDGSVHVTWRGDGAYFAVSYVSAARGRTFKVYDCEGKLQFSAEKCSQIRENIAWRPSGNWLAMAQRLPNKSCIALFEKNGLRHRDFTLPFDLDEEKVVQIKWSEGSDILAIRTKKNGSQSIYLYTIGNYHWYLKQVLVYDEQDQLAFFHWDSRLGSENDLHVCLESGKHLIHRWTFAVDRYVRGLVAVIDGKRLCLSDFAKAVIPPPMSQRVIEINDYINSITWHESTLCVYTSDKSIYIYQPLQQLSQEPPPVIQLKPNKELAHLQLSNLVNFNCDYLLATKSVGNCTRILLINKEPDIEEEEDKGEANDAVYKVHSSLKINGTVNAISIGASAMDQFYVQTIQNGHCYEISLKPDNSMKVERNHAQLAQPADQIEYFNLNSDSTAGIISLRSQQSLHLDGRRIADDVTSFCVVGNYLAYTQLNALHFVHLRNRRQVSSRNIERGGKLVTAIASEARVVLQMPRGNLEVICPRVLALDLVGALLQRRQYQLAMQMLRKQRINLNIICDHNVKEFVASIDIFLKEIKQSQWLCLFLSELQNEDLTQGMYSSNYEGKEQQESHYPDDYRVENKVEYISKLICQHMEKAKAKDDVNRYRLPIITSYVKLGHLEEALLLIWREKQRISEENLNLADDMLKYLLYMVDVNDLYNVALGTYDFGLVVFVAQKSQKDPKEFLPYLNELKSLPLDYRKFKIDEHLKRYAKALNHLAQCGEDYYTEALEFIKKHGLYVQGLQCYRNQKEFHQQICVAYADHLRSQAKLENASLMYERGGQLQQALMSARHILDWQRVLVLAKLLKESLPEVAMSMVGPLQQQSRHLEAYELVKDYVQDRDKQMEVLLEGHLYGRAIFEARLQGGNILADKVTPSLLAYVNQLQTSLEADHQLFLDYKKRLQIIRQQQASQGDGDGGGDVDIDEVDLLSDTTSMHSSRHSGSSRGTGKTFRSSKNRRKHERKLLSLKPGNPFEDIALIDALHNHITKIGQQQQVVHDTCKALLQVAEDGSDGDGDYSADILAASLQREFNQLLLTVESSLDEIWIPELAGGNGGAGTGTGFSFAQHLTGPNVDYLALKKEQRYALISPLKRFKPQLNIIDWPHDILL